MLLKLKKFCYLMLFISIWLPVVTANAQATATPVVVVGFDSIVLDALYQPLINWLTKFYADIVYEQPSPQLLKTVVNNQDYVNNLSALTQNLQNTSLQNIADSFGGVRKVGDFKTNLAQNLAGDDDPMSGSKSSIISSIFGKSVGSDQEATSKIAKEGNAKYDVENFLAPQTYTDAQKNNAAGYIKQMAALATPLIIGLAPDVFDVPLNNPKNPKQQFATVSLTKTQKDDLFSNPVYQKYKVNYRNVIAMRSLFLEPLERSYQERVQQNNGKSVRQNLNEQIEQRLSPDYYKAMAKASPVTIEREMLYVLIDIDTKLGIVREQNERLLIMDAVANLNRLNTDVNDLNEQATDLGKIIYCLDPKNAGDTLCAPQ